MKRKSVLLISFIVLTALLSSCSILTEMMQNATSTQPTPTFGTTTVKPRPRHDDNDNNGICDNCGGHFVDSKCMGAQCAEDGEHIWGEYLSNEYGHWRQYICGHAWPEIVEEHVDADEDRVCDVCGYDWNLKAIWCYDKNGHWMVYDSTNGHPVPDIIWSEGEHTFENDGVRCDKCPYCRHIDEDENNSCDICGDDFPD